MLPVPKPNEGPALVSAEIAHLLRVTKIVIIFFCTNDNPRCRELEGILLRLYHFINAEIEQNVLDLLGNRWI